jgi:ADP-ribosyl-[dinitrogen reductase] hydrolase
MLSSSILFGLAVGDALGVPVEFRKRAPLKANPVTEMMGYGTHNQPAGTWSDDSSLSFCLAESLTQPRFDLQNLSENFQKWLFTNYWTPHGYVFDVGITTQQAIKNLRTGCRPDLAGGMDESENGNGSLMRMLPLLLHLKDKEVDERYIITRQVSSITHAHARSVMACFYYLEFARQLLTTKDVFQVYKNLQTTIPTYLQFINMNKAEINKFDRLLKGSIHTVPEEEIYSSGYVLHTLEASIWCLLTTNSYAAAVLKAVNLGEDTDTTGAVTGGLAGLVYGYETIPNHWIEQLARKDDIADLAKRLDERFGT